jgi:Mo-dependent nitrogenase C-terminus
MFYFIANLTHFKFHLWRSPRQWFDSIEIHNSNLARLLCMTIPARCPFEREIKLLDRTLFRIPPLCKLNPFYEQVISLRFKCLSYLADECGEDVTVYC